jgi:hypothetical protein
VLRPSIAKNEHVQQLLMEASNNQYCLDLFRKRKRKKTIVQLWHECGLSQKAK